MVYASNGQCLLHLWREGLNYSQEKSHIFQSQFNSLRYSDLLNFPDSTYFRYDFASKPLPYNDNQMDAVYANHILEHFLPHQIHPFLKEVFRVLKPGGILRISTPDFEILSNKYLDAVEKYRENPSELNLNKIKWYIYVIIDQLVRENPGGNMLSTVMSDDPNAFYDDELYGNIFRPFKTGNLDYHSIHSPKHEVQPLSKLQKLNPLNIIRLSIKKWKWHQYAKRDKEVTDRTNKNFRTSIEIERFLHDRITLYQHLKEAGFKDIAPMDYRESRIKDWQSYNLDISDISDTPIEPSALLECSK